MLKKKHLIIGVIAIISMLALLSFQNTPEKSNLSSEETIEAVLQDKIYKLKWEYTQSCEKRVMETAVPIADSLIAEMYARDLRAQDTILLRPKRPEMPQVDINPFPFDSIE
jgi:hypothetical protein